MVKRNGRLLQRNYANFLIALYERCTTWEPCRSFPDITASNMFS
ncbi:unnamed protein product [Gongylonema pulchrum]|uniref:Uncharacterized protein n=1 Tax=Gongylonema pulchrum TaxID=637853 RepID=A0A3P6TDG1_9BILA|nr:unnamed protein product [Gongylonema pulchrum]